MEETAESKGASPLIGPYRLVEKIGEGGMGVVYLGIREGSGERVAVKMVRSLSPKLLSALRDEVVALKRIDHPGVIQVLDEGLSEGLPWYAMELLEGETLSSFNRSLWSTGEGELKRTQTTEGWTALAETLARAGLTSQIPEPWPGPEDLRSTEHRRLSRETLGVILDLYRGVCAALSHIHQRGMVHRDLKPSNVFLKAGLGPVLMDFGLASRAGGAIGRETLVSAVGTARAGSAHYMSPEQIRGDVVDARADLYSLGCMLYETLCGHPPFDSSRSIDTLSAQLEQHPLPVSQIVDVPPALDSLLRHLLAKTPQERLGYAEDVDAVLAELGGKLPPRYAPAVESQIPYLYRPRLAGRTDILATIEATLDSTALGRGALLLIGGESGIGKTFLATEVGRRAAARRFTALTGDCLPVASHNAGLDTQARASGAPFQPFRRLLQYVADRCRERGRDFTDHLLGSRGRILAQYEPSLAFALGQDQFLDPPIMVPAAARRRVFEALTETIVGLCEEQPLLWVLDDLQWADDLSLSFLGTHLAPLLAKLRLLLVATFRSDEMTLGLTALVESPHANVMNLGRLNESTISALVADMLGMPEIPDDLITFLSEHSEGNPFFVAEYLRVAVSESVLRRRGGRWQFDQGEGGQLVALSERLPVPRSIQDVVGRRLQDLDGTVRTVLSAAAVVGREVEIELLSQTLAATSADKPKLADSLEILRRRQILEWLDSGRVRFAHDKIREVAYDGIADPERRVLHARLARALELRTIWSAEQPVLYPRLAHHYERAGQMDRAAEYFLRAARLARIAFANEDAIRFYRAAAENLERALKNPLAPTVTRQLLVSSYEELGEILSLTGSHESAEAAYNNGLTLCQTVDLLARARLHRRIGKTRTARNQYSAALQMYATAEELLDVNQQASEAYWREWVELQTENVWGYYWTGDTSSLGRAIERLAPVVERHGTPAQRANFYQAFCLSELRQQRYRVSANTLALIRSAAREALESASPVESASVRFIYAFALIFFGRLNDARTEMQEVLQAANRLGDPLLKLRATAYLSLIYRQLSDVDRTRQLSLDTIDQATIQNAPHYLGAGQANRGWASYSVGLLPDAEHWLRLSLASWANAPTIYPFQDIAIWPLAAVLSQTSRRDEAVRHLRFLSDQSQRRHVEELDVELGEFNRRAANGDLSALGTLESLLRHARRHLLH